jgi:Histidine phosphatase superfamily (branch 1)
LKTFDIYDNNSLLGADLPAQLLQLIYLLFSGETDANKKHVLQGQSNFPLNEIGREQV